MDAGSQFERLVRLVQETGERMVIALDPHKDPVVLLPLSLYEELLGRSGKGVKNASPAVTGPMLPLSDVRASAPVRPPEPRFSPPRTPSVPPEDLSMDPVDTWDGESGEEYDAERIFASAEVGKGFAASSEAPDRLKASISRASEAYGMLGKSGWQAGNGGQRLPISADSLEGEERFSLGMG